MRRALLLVVLAAACVASVGCTEQLRPYGIEGYTLYTGWVARSPYWPTGVPRMTADQQRAFAEASWAEHERVYQWVDEQLDED
jgi:hypothetical protein